MVRRSLTATSNGFLQKRLDSFVNGGEKTLWTNFAGQAGAFEKLAQRAVGVREF